MAEVTGAKALGGDEGVAFGAYAFVTAGLSDGLPLEELLAHEDVDPRLWRSAEAAWLVRLTDDVEKGGLLCLELGALQARARESWARAIPPLDRELRAWLDFQRLLAERDDPLGYLASLGVTLGDMVRIQGDWTALLVKDAALREEAARVLEQPAEPVEVPRPAPPRLVERAPDTTTGTGFFAAVGEVAELPFVKRAFVEPLGEEEPYREAPALLAPLPEPPAEAPSADDTVAFELALERMALPFFTPRASPDPRDGDPNDDPGGMEEDLWGTREATPAPALRASSIWDSPASRNAAARQPAAGRPSRSDETRIGPAVPASAGLPFDSAPPRPPPPSAALLDTHEDAGATGVARAVDLGPELPFGPPGASADATVAEMAAVSEALPFSGSAPAPASIGPMPDARSGDTAVFTLGPPQVPPAEDEVRLVPGGLTLAQLAQFYVGLERSVGALGELLAMYGMDRAALKLHTDALNRFVAADPGHRARWEQEQARQRSRKGRGGT
jgi:hypothetical protein